MEQKSAFSTHNSFRYSSGGGAIRHVLLVGFISCIGTSIGNGLRKSGRECRNAYFAKGSNKIVQVGRQTKFFCPCYVCSLVDKVNRCGVFAGIRKVCHHPSL
jgi:hypothetical protein